MIAMALVILVAAFAIDASEWFAKHHQAQVSADASALAAANCLATQKCTSTATGGDAYNTATTYAVTDGVPANSVTIGGGFVTVTTSTAAPTTFAGVIGLHPNASAHAVASYDQATVADNLYAQDCSAATVTLSQPVNSSSCAVDCTQHGITISTSGNTLITGAIQTNGSLKIAAHNNDTLGLMLYGNPAGNNCSGSNQVSGGKQPYGPPQEESSFAVFPDTYTTAVTASTFCTPPSTYYGSNATASQITASSGNGTYTGSNQISVSGSLPVAIVNNVIQGTVTIGGNFGSNATPVTICALHITDTAEQEQLTAVTLSASSISLSANGFGITPDPNNTPDSGESGPALSIYDNSTSASNTAVVSGNSTNITGAIYAPASDVNMEANNGGLSFWEANMITFSGNNAAGGPTQTLPGLGSDALVQ